MEQQPNSARTEAAAAVAAAATANGRQQQEQLQSQSAITAYDKLLQDKERVIRESIAKKFRNIHAVERQLADLQMALHVNVGPRRQALEHLRSKIEEQNTKIDLHRSAVRKAKAAMEEAQHHLEAEERVKQQLGLELNMLVQESSTAQLKKLEELSRELEHLTDGGQSKQTTIGGGSAGCGAAGEDGGDAVVVARAQQVPKHQQQQQRQQQAAEARGRHVQLGGQSQTRIPAPPADSARSSSEPFQGF